MGCRFSDICQVLFFKWVKSMKTKKVLSVFSLVMINIIAVDSIRTLPISAEYGLSVIFYYLLGAVCFMIPVALIAAELSSAWPEEGGIYVWVREAFGKRWGLFVAWVQWVYNIVWYPSILAFLVMTVFYVVNPALTHDKFLLLGIIIALFWVATLFNCFGMRIASWTSSISALVGTLLPLLAFMVMTIVWLVEKRPVAIALNWSSLLPSFSGGNNLGILTGLVFGLIGLEMSAIHASDVEKPKRDYPRALLISVVLILISMIFGSLAVSLVIPVGQLNLASGVIAAFELFLKAYGLAQFAPVIAGCIVIGGLGGVAAWILGPGRCLMVASRDGAAPAFFNRKNRFGAPIRVLLTQAAIFTVLCSFYLFFPNFNTAYWLLTAITAQLALMVYMVLFLAAIRLRFKAPDQQRAFKVPGGKVGLVFVGGLGFLTCLSVFALGFMPPENLQIRPLGLYEALLCGCILLFAGLPFWVYSRVKKQNS